MSVVHMTKSSDHDLADRSYNLGGTRHRLGVASCLLLGDEDPPGDHLHIDRHIHRHLQEACQ